MSDWKMKRLLTVGALIIAAVPAHAFERKIVLRDYTGRGFVPDVVQYAVPAAGADKLRVYAADGTALPAQVGPGDNGNATLSFIADLPANATATYTLRDDGTPMAANSLRIAQEADTTVLENGGLAVRLPAEAAKTFAPAVPANSLPAPILAFKSGASAWLGEGRLLSTQLVTAYRVAIVTRGPVFAEVRYELTFANGGYYHANIRVADRVPLVKVSEEFDQKTLTDSEYWSLDITRGWNPDSAEVASTNGNGQIDAGKNIPLSQLGVTPNPIAPQWGISPDGAWGPRSQLGLFNAADAKADPANCTRVGFVPLHKGNWRRMNVVEIQTPDSKQISLRLPLGVRWATWVRDVTSETSPFSMEEHDPALPATYGRREWGLVLGAPPRPCNGEGGVAIGPFYQSRLYYGVVGLDRYKDYLLDWPDKGTGYPRVFLHPQEIEKYRRSLDNSPRAIALKAKWYALSGDEAVARTRTADALHHLSWLNNDAFTSPTVEHHIWSANYFIAAAADDALSWAAMPSATRAELRARLALAAYLYEDPDVMSYGNGAHTGNPNMQIARTMGVSNFVALLPDHPMYPAWRIHADAYTTYKVGIMMAPGGGWDEFGAAYHMHSYARVTNAMPALETMAAPHLDELFAKHAADWSYYLNLLTPYDSRWGARMIPGLANSNHGYTEHFLEASGTLAARDPALAANLKWGWAQNGANDRGDPVWSMDGILDRPWLTPVEPALTSQIYPGVGVVFRAHQGPNETYMFLRSGNNWSHWTEDQGHVILMSKGALLFPYQPYQYWSAPRDDFDMANVIRFGAPTNKLPQSWPDSNIIDHAFGPTVDYAWSATGFPDWYITPGATAAYRPQINAPVMSGFHRELSPGSNQKEGAFTWNRQVMFLKGAAAMSPNYFVFRDTMRGSGELASWMNLNFLGRKSNIKIDGAHVAVDTEWPTKLDLLFAQDQPIAGDFLETNQGNPINAATDLPWFRFMKEHPQPISPNWVRNDGQPLAPGQMPDVEQHVTLRIPGAPGQGYTWLAYPRAPGETLPAVTTLAPGALKIVTSESTDYVFISPIPIAYAGDGVTFSGYSGSVRVTDRGATLALCGGPGSVGYKGQEFSGSTPFEHTIALADLRIKTVAFAPPRYKIAYRPTLTGHQPVGAGVRKAIAGQATEYLIDSSATVTVTDGPVHIEASHGAISIAPRGIRFVVTDREPAYLTVGNVGVHGLGPFDLTFTDNTIEGNVDGDIRTLAVTWPGGIVRPMFHMDGVRYYAGWADDHAISHGTASPQFALAFGLTAGPHQVEVGQWQYPALPAVPPRVSP